MVRREPDQHTLYFIGSDGQKVSVSPFDWQYQIVEATQDLQISSVWQNRQRKNNYLGALSNAQGNLNSGRPCPTPEKPKMISVSDPTCDEYGMITMGVSEEVDWIPSLPSLIPITKTS